MHAMTILMLVSLDAEEHDGRRRDRVASRRESPSGMRECRKYRRMRDFERISRTAGVQIVYNHFFVVLTGSFNLPFKLAKRSYQLSLPL